MTRGAIRTVVSVVGDLVGGQMTYPGDLKDWRESALVRRWHRRKSQGRIEELALSPGDLRTPEAGFLEELTSGSIGLAGRTLTFANGSPFRLPAPSATFARELHGFGWLRHLEASRDDAAEAVARKLMLDWVRAGGRAQSLACEPGVTARRVISWLAHNGIALNNAPLADYDAVMDALSEDVSWLERKTAALETGLDRLFCGLALLEAAICRELDAAAITRLETRFLDDLSRQFALDGVHLSRSPAAAIDLLLDLVPLRQLYAARRVAPPDVLTSMIEKMQLALARLRLGDGSIARFNGMGATVLEHVSVLLGGSGSGLGHGSAIMADAGYARLEAGKTIVLADAGGAPRDPWRAAAHAGMMSFEMSLGRAPLVSNGGVDVSGDAAAATAARATVNASTLVLGHQSSLPPSGGVDAGGTFDDGPGDGGSGAVTIEAHHAGYRGRFGLVHQRRLSLTQDGRRLDGSDRLAGSADRLAAGIPYAVHFRLHPSVRVDLEANGEVRLAAANGMRARFKAEQGITTVERATFLAGQTGPLPCMAIVVHARTSDADTIDWHIAVGV